ncbi:hypothetical protein GZL_08222 [Streptomyces sp. 769]|nr:hypothetical protein GZL_08222 [Streptomyces sp. 769]
MTRTLTERGLCLALPAAHPLARPGRTAGHRPHRP